MTREEAIRTLHQLWRETYDPWYEEVYTMAKEALSNDDVQEWIPVSERLPEGGTSVLVYSDVGHIVGYYDDVVGLWYGLRPFIDNIELIVYAWMPLPTPYKGGDLE